ncbi:TetR/AcrR family transcriptional regulator [Nonomuraea sp. NPDC005983]|uniref:TetR/AcrR family transcriptional regulator n=1 Tax=Nonomuraea sp. NPDC005983 TaxID=3155595 RepID=UPI0033BA8679
MTSAPGPRQRRRGQVLEAAIYDAVLAELAAVGYRRLTMEGIAARARTAKSTLYRRWNSREDLVIAAVHQALPYATDVQDGGGVRADLVAALGLMAENMSGPMGRVIASVLGDFGHAPELQDAAREKIIAPRIRSLRAVFERAAARGEIRPGAVTPFVVQAGPSIVFNNCILQGLRLTSQDIENIVDQVLMPAVRPS